MNFNPEEFLAQPLLDTNYSPSQMQVKPFFPPVIDSTIMAAFRSCPQRAFRQYIQHWKPQNESVHLVAGGAFAAGLEAARTAYFVHGVEWELAQGIGLAALTKHYGDFQPPEGSAKTLERMLGALQFYYERYPFPADPAVPATLPGGKKGIEFSFAVPLPIRHPTTGDPLVYAGRADMVVEYCGALYLEDDKTASQLGASWSRQWDLRSQFSGYTWAAKQAGIDVQGTLVRGISILKTKYDTQEALTSRSNWELERWYGQLLRDIHRMLDCWEESYFDYSLDAACTEYGGCLFQSTCRSSSPDEILGMYFQQKVWDPIGRQEHTPASWEAFWRGGSLE